MSSGNFISGVSEFSNIPNNSVLRSPCTINVSGCKVCILNLTSTEYCTRYRMANKEKERLFRRTQSIGAKSGILLKPFRIRQRRLFPAFWGPEIGRICLEVDTHVHGKAQQVRN